MATDPTLPAENEPSGKAASLSTEEVVQRLDQLWSQQALPIAGSLTGQRIGRYEIEGTLGHGTFGIVYLARDLQLDRQVALKLPRQEVLLDPRKRARFDSEATVAASLNHPAIVPILEANLEGPTPFIVSAYCPGMDLAQWLARRDTPVPFDDAMHFVIQLAEGVQYAHECGIFHRDIKPSNVLLVHGVEDTASSAQLSRYSPCLSDFGLAKLVQDSLDDTRSSLLIGTPLYMAPELFTNSSSDGASASADIYSLGCLLYELLSGKPPIEGESYIQVVDRLREAQPEQLRRFRPDIPRSLEAICAKCLEKDPAARYDSASALVHDLEACLNGQPVTINRARPHERFAYWQRQPKRIRDAGLFAIGFHALSSLWLLSCALLIPKFDILSHSEYWLTIREQVSTIVMFDVPMLVIGWQTLRERRWAVRLGLLMSSLQVLLLFATMVGDFKFFQFIYRNAEYHQAANYALIFICTAVQLLLFVLAMQATRRHSA